MNEGMVDHPMAGNTHGDYHGEALPARPCSVCEPSRILEIQRDLAIGLFSCATLADCLNLLLESALRLPGFDCGAAYLCCGPGGALRMVAHCGLSSRFVKDAAYFPEDTFQARSIAEGRLIYDMARDLPPEISEWILAEGMQALAVLPIQVEGRAVACLCASSRSQHEVSRPLRLAIEGFAAFAGGAVGLIESREQLEARVKERTGELQESNSMLRDQAARLELVLAASEAGVSSWDFATGKIEWDARMHHLYGLDHEGPVRIEEVLERIHPDDRTRLLRVIDLIEDPLAGNDWSHEFRIRHPELGERWIGRSGRIERDASGRPLRALGISMDITARKTDEQRLMASEEKYRLLHESMNDAFAAVDLDGNIIESNKAFRDMLGYSAGELGRMTFFDITPERWHAFERELAEHSGFFQSGCSEIYEKEYRRKDGSEFPVEVRAFLVRDGSGQPQMIWGIIRDITARKQAEKNLLEWNQALEKQVGERTALLEQSEVRFRQLAEATFEGIGMIENGVLVDCNEQLARMHGCGAGAMTGLPFIDLFAPGARDEVRHRLTGEDSNFFETICLRCDGTTFPAEIRLSAREWQGRRILVTAVRDMTELKEASARLQTLHSELQQVQRLGLVSEISAGIIHQIGQPLTSLGINLSVAIDRLRAADSERLEILEVMEEAEQDIRLVRNTISHLRSLVNPGRPVYPCFDANDMVLDVMGLVACEAARRRVRVEADLHRPLPEIGGDPVQLSQVLLVLLRNAFDAVAAMPAERRIIRVITRPADPGKIALCVIDSGDGIAEEVRSRLFAPFLTSKPEGFGIGLRLSQTIVTAHGGSIRGCNRNDAPGAEFEVTLPVCLHNHQSPDVAAVIG
jgi:PAS domain S-box-containing protein